MVKDIIDEYLKIKLNTKTLPLYSIYTNYTNDRKAFHIKWAENSEVNCNILNSILNNMYNPDYISHYI
jgi:hypothetical protein